MKQDSNSETRNLESKSNGKHTYGGIHQVCMYVVSVCTNACVHEHVCKMHELVCVCVCVCVHV